MAGRAVMADNVGGDYWDVPFPARIDIGQLGRCFLGVAAAAPSQGFASPAFNAAAHRTLTYRVRTVPKGGPLRAELRDAAGAVLATRRLTGAGFMVQDAIDLSSIANRKNVRLHFVPEGTTREIQVDAVMLHVGAAPVFTPRSGDPVAEPDGVFGFADLHTHPAAHLAFGGQNGVNSSLIFGSPTARWENDWRSCSHSGPHVNTSIFTEKLEPAGHAGTGYPDFRYWPRFNSVTHQQLHVNWLRRAWRGGLRLMVMQAVNNALLGRYFAAPDRRDAANDMVSARAQLTFLRNMIQSSDFMEVARDPAAARAIIRRGKLAIVLGLEVDSLGSCHEHKNVLGEQFAGKNVTFNQPCSLPDMRRMVDELYDQYDVRHIFPVHLADNDFGGAALYRREFGKFNAWLRGRDFSPVDAANPGSSRPPIPFIGVKLTAGHDVVDDFIAGLFGNIGMDNKSWNGGPHVNGRGLERLGGDVIRYMWDRGMNVDIDHMSELASREVMSNAEARGVAVAAGHTMPRELLFMRDTEAHESKLAAENNKSDQQIRRLHALGGVMGLGTGPVDGRASRPFEVPNRCPGSTTSWLQSYIHTVQLKTGTSPFGASFVGVALGTDMHLQAQLYPRFGVWACMGRDLGVLATAVDPKRPMVMDEVDAQEHGVTYTTRPFTTYSSRFQRPVGDGTTGGFANCGFNDCGLPGAPYLDSFVRFPTEAYGGRERAVWHGIYLAEALRRKGEDPIHDLSSAWNWWHWTDGAIHFALGFAQSAAQTSHDCSDVHPTTGRRLGAFGCGERRVAYLVKNNLPADPADHPDVQAAVRRYRPMVSRVWRSFNRMNDGNTARPLQRCEGADCGGNREFDYNIDGLAHYGLVPDMLQDAANQLRTASGPVRDLSAMFHGAEDYIQMWERTYNGRAPR